MKRLRWIPVIAYAGLIFYMSSRPWPGQMELFEGADKLIHFAMYFILGFGLVWSLRATRYRFSRNIVLIAALVGLLYGASDEFHQSFVPGRTASPFDLIADGLGCLAGAWMAIVAARRLRKEKAVAA